jgi:hypothetical protein
VAFRLVLTVLLVLMSTASAPPPRPDPPAAQPKYFLTVILVGACRPSVPQSLPTDPWAPQPFTQDFRVSCLDVLDAYLGHMKGVMVPRPEMLRQDLELFGLTGVVIWGPDADLSFAGWSGERCITGEIGEGGYLLKTLPPDQAFACRATSR